MIITDHNRTISNFVQYLLKTLILQKTSKFPTNDQIANDVSSIYFLARMLKVQE